MTPDLETRLRLQAIHQLERMGIAPVSDCWPRSDQEAEGVHSWRTRLP